MKSKIIILLLFISTITLAQEKSYFGIKAGYNLSSIKDSDVDNRNGFHIGMYGEHKLNSHVAFQPELQYSQLGFKDGTNTTVKLDYIQLPLMFKTYIFKPLYIELGPQFGLNISKKEETDLFFGTTTETTEPNNFDWGFNGGFGISINPGITIGARYYQGIGSAYADTDVFNTLYQVFVGINLDTLE